MIDNTSRLKRFITFEFISKLNAASTLGQIMNFPCLNDIIALFVLKIYDSTLFAMKNTDQHTVV